MRLGQACRALLECFLETSEDGRYFRCSICKHEWHVEPPIHHTEDCKALAAKIILDEPF